jgi:hypothetical protein
VTDTLQSYLQHLTDVLRRDVDPDITAVAILNQSLYVEWLDCSNEDAKQLPALLKPLGFDHVFVKDTGYGWWKVTP